MLRKYGCAIAIALVAAGAGAGCGGDDDEALTKAEFIKQGDAICKKAAAEGEKEADEMFADLGPNDEPSEEQLTTFVEDVLKPNIEGQLNDLRDLTPPEEDEETINAVYEQVETGLAKLENDPLAILSDEDPLADANQAAEDYGFKECSQ